MDAADRCKIGFREVVSQVLEEECYLLGNCFYVFALACNIEFALPRENVLDVVSIPCCTLLHFH